MAGIGWLRPANTGFAASTASSFGNCVWRGAGFASAQSEATPENSGVITEPTGDFAAAKPSVTRVRSVSSGL